MPCVLIIFRIVLAIENRIADLVVAVVLAEIGRLLTDLDETEKFGPAF